ncbi:hypothetical protein L218DRAFT_941025 [Marasmius fiardii PR-910]|nr:hypothetical protein L218DRAFT_941025 [Marasmius fiardii PR-910]
MFVCRIAFSPISSQTLLVDSHDTRRSGLVSWIFESRYSHSLQLLISVVFPAFRPNMTAIYICNTSSLGGSLSGFFSTAASEGLSRLETKCSTMGDATPSPASIVKLQPTNNQINAKIKALTSISLRLPDGEVATASSTWTSITRSTRLKIIRLRRREVSGYTLERSILIVIELQYIKEHSPFDPSSHDGVPSVTGVAGVADLQATSAPAHSATLWIISP